MSDLISSSTLSSWLNETKKKTEQRREEYIEARSKAAERGDDTEVAILDSKISEEWGFHQAITQVQGTLLGFRVTRTG